MDNYEDNDNGFPSEIWLDFSDTNTNKHRDTQETNMYNILCCIKFSHEVVF